MCVRYACKVIAAACYRRGRARVLRRFSRSSTPRRGFTSPRVHHRCSNDGAVVVLVVVATTPIYMYNTSVPPPIVGRRKPGESALTRHAHEHRGAADRSLSRAPSLSLSVSLTGSTAARSLNFPMVTAADDELYSDSLHVMRVSGRKASDVGFSFVFRRFFSFFASESEWEERLLYCGSRYFARCTLCLVGRAEDRVNEFRNAAATLSLFSTVKRYLRVLSRSLNAGRERWGGTRARGPTSFD